MVKRSHKKSLLAIDGRPANFLSFLNHLLRGSKPSSYVGAVSACRTRKRDLQPQKPELPPATISPIPQSTCSSTPSVRIGRSAGSRYWKSTFRRVRVLRLGPEPWTVRQLKKRTSPAA